MRTFGGFQRSGEKVYGEVRGEEVHLLARPYWLGLDFTGDVVPLGELKIDLPVAPSKLMAVGLNYADHIAEMKRTPLGTPLIWFKAPTSLLPHEGTIEIAFPEHKTDFEVELAIVIGARASYVTKEDAARHIAGYALHNDYSERSFQLEHGGQWSKGKSADTFAPLGPFLATADEIKDPQALPMWLTVNGESRQKSSTANMIFDVYTLVSYLSQFMSLLPGDVISTGTPAGVGLGIKPEPVYLKVGDVVELGIDGLGRSRQKVAPSR